MAKMKAKAKTRKKPVTKAVRQAKRKPSPKKVDLTGLRGFARLKVTDPDRFKAISAKAGKKAQKLFGKKVRWTKKKARELASLGGKAAQAKYRKTGHPWAAGSPLRPDSRAHVQRDRRDRRGRTDRRRVQRRVPRVTQAVPQNGTQPVQAPIEAPEVQMPVEGQGVSLVPSEAQPEAPAEAPEAIPATE